MERRGCLPAGLIMQHGDLPAMERKRLNKVAQRIKIIKFRFDVIATSPLQRAQKTTTIVASVPGQKDKSPYGMSLLPGGDPDTVCSNASQQGNNTAVLIIGHKPALSVLISKIISGDLNGSIVLSGRRSG